MLSNNKTICSNFNHNNLFYDLIRLLLVAIFLFLTNIFYIYE